MFGRVGRIAALMLLAACGRKIDGVLYSTMDGGGKRLADREVVVVPATSRTADALAQFCREQVKRSAALDSVQARFERRSQQLSADAAQELARNGASRRWRQLLNEATAAQDSARTTAFDSVTAGKVARELAVARVTTNRNGEFHITKVPFGKHLLVATAEDDWGDVISVGFFQPTKADLSTDRAMPGCVLGSDFGR
jgi:hypothetical protein